jgi:hypothetical protein
MVDGMFFRYGLPCGFAVFLTSANKMLSLEERGSWSRR